MKKDTCKSFGFLLFIVLALAFIGCSIDNTPTVTVTGDSENLIGKLLILQAYGSGATAAGASHSFVELYNITDEPISLSGVTLYYANGIRGVNIIADSPWKSIALTGTIPAKGSYLIAGSRQSTIAQYQMPDYYGDINNNDFMLSTGTALFNRAFKVAIIQGSPDLNNPDIPNPFDIDGSGKKIAGYIDMAGAANAPTDSNPDNIFGFEKAPARCSASEAIRRKDLNDTDNNSIDFISLRYASGNNGMTDAELEARRPRNSSAG